MKIRRIVARLQSMSASEIRGAVPANVIADLKKSDPTALIRAYVVGREGPATPKLLGYGTVLQDWAASAVIKISERLWYGTPVYIGHYQASKDEVRDQIGYVVYSETREERDRLVAFAYVYIYPEYRDLPLDVASIEADIEVDPTQSDSIHAVNVLEITGIALGDSAKVDPGFVDATVQGQLQAFTSGQSHKFNKHGGRDVEMTISDVKDFIKANKTKPSDIFGLGELTDDPSIKGYVSEQRKEASAGEFVHRKRTDEKFDEEREKWEKEKKELEGQLAEQRKAVAKVNSGDLFSKKITERKLTDQQKKFIEARREQFSPEDPEKLDKEVDTFMDAQLEEFKKNAEIFGVKTTDASDDDVDNIGDEPKGGAPGKGGDDADFIPD